MGGTSHHILLVAASASAPSSINIGAPIAAAVTEIELVEGQPSRRLKLLPLGTINMRDGRGPYRLRDRKHAEEVVAATQAFFGSADMPGDYDHQMQYAVKPGVGGKAKASAWVKHANLTVEDDGIYANEVDWTPAATAGIVAKEYRYLSPLFYALPPEKGGDVLQIKNFALVNIGAIDLPAVAAGLTEESDQMDLTALAALLGLDATATAEQVAAAIGELKNVAPSTSAIAIAAGLDGGATVETIAAAVASMKAPDMSNYVPKVVVQPLLDEVKKQKDIRLGQQVDDLIAAGVVIPSKRKDTLDWFEKDEVAASAFFKGMPPLLAPGAEIVGGKPTEKATALDAAEQALAVAAGMSDDEFLALKNVEIA